MSNPIKKSMVWLGLADDQFEYDEPAAVATVPIAPAPRGQVTPLPKRQPTLRAAPVVPVLPGLSEIVTVHPRQYRDAQAIAEHFREGTPVILNLSQMSEAEARRLVDFASGLSTGLRGRIERVTSKVFLLSPEHIATSGDQGTDSELEAGFAE